MLDLLIIGVSWPPEIFIQRKIENLAAKGLKVSFAVPVPLRKFRKSIKRVKVLRLPHWDDPITIRVFQCVWYGLILIFKLRKGLNLFRYFIEISSNQNAKEKFSFFLKYVALAQCKPQIVHFEWNSAAINYEPFIKLWNCPFVISCRGSQINVRPHVPGNNEFVSGIERTFQKAAAVHCVSEEIKKEAMKYGLSSDKAWVIHPSVDPDFFRGADIRKSNNNYLNIIITSPLRWVKGYEYALLTIHHLVKKKVPIRFDIIGNGPERLRILFSIQDLNLEKYVFLHGKLPPERVRDKLQKADVFLLSSLSEGISNSVIEAMACELPIVTTDCGGMREAVTDGEEGFVVQVRDIKAMARAIMTLWENPSLRKEMGQAGRKRILKDFTLDQQAEKFIRLYQTILG